MPHPDVIILGLGAMGSAAAYHLASSGVRVVGLEQFSIPHNLGSSHGGSRMIRMAYYEHPDYVPLLRRAYELWDDLQCAVNQKLLHVTGGLYLGPAASMLVKGSLDTAQRHGLAHELLSRREIAAQFRAFHIPDDWSGLYEDRAGYLLPEAVVSAFAQRAMLAGARLHGHEPALEWKAGPAEVTVVTSRATYHAKHLVICGGAWSSKLLADLGIPLVVTRQVVGWVSPRNPLPFWEPDFPVWAIDHLDGTIHYGFPLNAGGIPGLKLGHHGAAIPTHPDHVDRTVTDADEQTFRPALSQFLPDADGPLLSLQTCLYTNSPDHHFLIDRHPAHPNVHFAAGFSGHGFKFASVIGEILADLATTGSTQHPISFLGINRFQKS